MPYDEPTYYKQVNNLDVSEIQVPNNFNSSLEKLMSSPNIASKHWIYDQYDSTVRTNTVYGPGGDAGVIRIRNPKGLAMSTDCMEDMFI